MVFREDLRTDRGRPCATGCRQIIEVPKMAEEILDVLVPEMVEQLVKLPKTVSEDRIQ